MRSGSTKTGAIILAFCTILGSAGLLRGQGWVQETNVSAPSSIVTTGGITYANYWWAVAGCGSMKSVGPLTRNGNDFSMDFDYEMETGVACPDDISTQSATIVLGALAPGEYELTTTSWGTPVTTTNFTVLPTSTPMLQSIGFSTNGSFQIQLNGVANVSYVLQSSTDLVNWTSLSTNSAGQPLTNTPPASASKNFYRVQIPQIVNVGPGMP